MCISVWEIWILSVLRRSDLCTHAEAVTGEPCECTYRSPCDRCIAVMLYPVCINHPVFDTLTLAACFKAFDSAFAWSEHADYGQTSSRLDALALRAGMGVM
eukprot:jgi/Ulvmu1/4184/UM019_0163.1